MKWVKVAIGAVIAIAVVPMIALSVFNLTQGQLGEEVVTFTINVTDETYSPNVLNDIAEFGITNESGYFTNVIEVKLNDVITNDLNIGYDDNTNIFNIYSIGLDGSDSFDSNGDYLIGDGVFQDGDVISITFDEVTQAPILSGVTATLLLLAPVIFVSGVLYFIYNNKQEGI